MTAAGLAMWTLGVAAIAFTLGWAAAQRAIEHRQSKANDLRMMVRVAILGHVGVAE